MANVCKMCLFILLPLSLLVACGDNATEPENFKPISSLNTALPKNIPIPKSNPQTASKIELGRLLFFDPILSGTKDVACATCHHPSHGYAEFLDLSIGVNGKGLFNKRHFKSPNNIPLMKRNAHTILNTAFNGITSYASYDPATAPMFWDLRAQSLETQSLMPIKVLEEMRGDEITEDVILDTIISRLRSNEIYLELFSDVFKTENPIDTTNLAKALASFERSLNTNNSRFDQYMRGDETALTETEIEAFQTFRRVGCANCHNGPMFSDYKEHVLAVPENKKLNEPDKGLNDTYAFRTPTLRNLRFTAPYMHNGRFKSLEEVLEFYEDVAAGRNINSNISTSELDPLINQINIKVRDMPAIISFLNTLSDDSFSKEVPESVPSGLSVGGDVADE